MNCNKTKLSSVVNKVVSFILATVLVASFVPATALAAESVTEGTQTKPVLQEDAEASSSSLDIQSTDEDTDEGSIEDALSLDHGIESNVQETNYGLNAQDPEFVEFYYLSSKEAVVGEQVSVVLSFKESIALDNARLRYQKDGGAIQSIRSDSVIDDAVSFVFDLQDRSSIGEYTLIDIVWEGDERGSFVIPESDDGVSFTVFEAPENEGAEITVSTINEQGELVDAVEVEDALDQADGVDSITSTMAKSARAAKKDFTIMLDPGHGGSDPGAVSGSYKESYYNLMIAKYCRDALMEYSGVKVYMTRTSDVYVGLEERVDKAVDVGADLFVSFHINSATASANGFEVWIQNDSSWNYGLHKESEELAKSVLQKLSALGLTNRGTKQDDYTINGGKFYPDGSWADSLSVLRNSRWNDIPAILIEHAFISNASDRDFLNNNQNLMKLGMADAEGIASYYHLLKGVWEKQSNGDWKYKLSDGTYASDQWLMDGGYLYYLDASGVMSIGWKKIDDLWYYFNPGGDMVTGWKEINGDWYYLNPGGDMATGWKQVGASWYYLDPTSGIMQTGWLTLGNNTYYLRPAPNGSMVTGLQVIDGKTYAFAPAPAGHMIKGQWYYVNGANRYFLDDGVMATGKVSLNGEDHYFTNEGTAAIGWTNSGSDWFYIKSDGTPHKGWLSEGSYRYYLDPLTGVMRTGLQSIDNGVYFFKAAPSGIMLTGLQSTPQGKYYFNANGTTSNGWIKIGGYWYYFDPSNHNKAATGWKTIGNRTYYLHPDCTMAQGWKEIDGNWHYFITEGTMQKGWLSEGGYRYYLDPQTGIMRDGYQVIDGKKYFFKPAPSGILVTGIHSTSDGVYCFNANGVTSSGWIKSGSYWYYFDPANDNKAATGWKTIGNRTYYLHPNYTMAQGWNKINNKWYYFIGEGTMQTGWQKLTGGWYYLDPNDSGAMSTGWKTIGSRTYYLDPANDSRMVMGWKEIDGNWHYFITEGTMQKDWTQVGANWYYLDPTSGAMATGWKTIGNNTYYLRPAPNGSMVTGFQTIDGKKYVFAAKPYGHMLKGQWCKNPSDGYWYWPDRADGHILTSTFVNDGIGDSYVGSDGRMVTGWLKLDGKEYYFNSAGYMQRSKWIGQYWVGEDGAWVPDMKMMPIMGYSDITADKLASVFNRKSTYPAIYANSDAPNAKRFFEILIEEANAEGVRADVVAAQSMLETGWLKFGGIVLPEQYNFAGLGALDGNATGNCASFRTIREGLRAQVQHLKAYATSADVPLNNTCVDPRFHLVRRGAAPVVEWLGIHENPQGVGWASAYNYGVNIVSLIKKEFS